MNIPSDYYSKLAFIESSNNPNAQAKTSSASGLYQFTRFTWEELGYNWDDRFNVVLQHAAINDFTERNACVLASMNIPLTCENLYAAHFLGPGMAVHVLKEPASTELVDILPHSVLAANTFLNGMTVQDFNNWLQRKFDLAIKV